VIARVVAVAALVACGAPAPVDTPSHRSDPRTPVAAGTDRDDDGVDDAIDRCAIAPEDVDLHEDADGCPELDDDHDGVPDLEDNCFDTPGIRDGGCPVVDDQNRPVDCGRVVTITDCFFITPLWSVGGDDSALLALRDAFKQYPQIREVTLTSLPAATAHIARAKLIALGVPARLLVIGRGIPNGNYPKDVAYGRITRQQFATGKFRITQCAAGVGEVYLPDRTRNYHCNLVICGDGRCTGYEEERATCPADCPP